MDIHNHSSRYSNLIHKLVSLEAHYRRLALEARKAGEIYKSDKARQRANILAVRLAKLDMLFTQNKLRITR